MPARKDLTGQRFGQLTVIKDDGTRQGNKVLWLCRCTCGNRVRVTTSNLTSGNTTSCGHEGRMTALKKYQDKVKATTPGTRLDLLGNSANKNSKTGYRNISIIHYRGEIRYRVAVTYKRKQYGGTRKTMAEVLILREKLRTQHWPGYVSTLDAMARDLPKPPKPARELSRDQPVKGAKFIEDGIQDVSDRFKQGTHLRVTIERDGKSKYVGTYATIEKARLNRDRALAGKPTDKSDKYRQEAYIEPGITKTPSGNFRVQIYRGGKDINAGTFKTIEEARKAHQDAEH
ncbi:hypothetical protein [Levilactobacillus namurensis]|uniref:hypothetical protein n=1 Tax=Levilactobacillus namurensis TaxID=380393 RepID=UPI0026EA4A50|nr:hypothetical protein [Levilactobacillus namurensis]